MQVLKTVRAIMCALAVIVTHSATAATIEATPFGAPTWTPVDFNMFSAPIGTVTSGYAEAFETVLSLLPEPKHRTHPGLGVGPGDPHDPPYDQELSNGVANRGFQRKTVFSGSEFSNGEAAQLAFMAVPTLGSGTGSSPDFASGLIIPNSLFPIHSHAESWKDGMLFSDPVDFDVPALDALVPPFNVQGHSHFPLFYNENVDFARHPELGIAGSYEFRITLTDNSGAGWQIIAPYQVVPEPGTAMLLVCGIAALVYKQRNGNGRKSIDQRQNF